MRSARRRRAIPRGKPSSPNATRSSTRPVPEATPRSKANSSSGHEPSPRLSATGSRGLGRDEAQPRNTSPAMGMDPDPRGTDAQPQSGRGGAGEMARTRHRLLSPGHGKYQAG